MNPDPQKWEDGGIPDNVMFRRFAIPYLCFARALDERLYAATRGHYSDIGRYNYFFSIDYGTSLSMRWILTIPNHICDVAENFVNPNKIATAIHYSDCFWTFEEMRQEIGEDLYPASESDIKPFLPDWPIKYVKPMYNAINLLRYLPTTEEKDWPDEFDYKDKNDTFKFKAP